MKYALTCTIAFLSFIQISFCQSWNTDTANNLSTVDGIIHALYNDISGPVGEQRNWNDFRNLFADNARMYIAVANNDNSLVLKSLTPEEYIQRNQTRLWDIGFNEDECIA